MVLRSVAAVVGGIAVFSVSLLAAMSLGNALAGTESEWVNRSVTTQVGWLIWNVVSMVAAGYLTAVVAAREPLTHALVMGGVQSLFTLAAMLTVTGDVTPLWLWLAGIVATIPAAWMGARIQSGAIAAR